MINKLKVYKTRFIVFLQYEVSDEQQKWIVQNYDDLNSILGIKYRISFDEIFDNHKCNQIIANIMSDFLTDHYLKLLFVKSRKSYKADSYVFTILKTLLPEFINVFNNHPYHHIIKSRYDKIKYRFENNI